MKRTMEFVRALTGEEASGIGPCECGAPLALVHLYEYFEKGRGVKQLLCCTRKACDNSMQMTARIHGAKIEDAPKPPPTSAEDDPLLPL